MAALSPTHFLLLARLTTASPAPSATQSEGTNPRTSLVSPPADVPASHICQFPPTPPFSCFDCVCVGVGVWVWEHDHRSNPFVSGVLLSWLCVCLYRFLCFCHTLSHLAALCIWLAATSPFFPRPPPEGVRMRRTELSWGSPEPQRKVKQLIIEVAATVLQRAFFHGRSADASLDIEQSRSQSALHRDPWPIKYRVQCLMTLLDYLCPLTR